LAWAVKLNKRDFLGQPALQRVEREGLRQRLVGFKMVRPDVVPDEGLQIVARNGGGELDLVGWVTSCKHSPTLGETIGLCWLPLEVADREGASFSIYMDGREAEARVHHGPFYDPDGERQT
jgi:glycine cleavage system aminomethyltransferase T